MPPEFGEPIEHLPLVPQDVLKKHRVNEPTDTRFRAVARLMQALWREDRDLPIGSYKAQDGKVRKLGSRISKPAALAGANFLTPEIARITRRHVIYREVGAFIDEERLTGNLLSSMPLCFNLFAPMTQALEQATGLLAELVPSFHGRVTRIRFEHSPGRGHPKYLSDYSAFDVFVDYVMADGRRGFVAIEVKYAESMREPVPEMRPRYDEVSRACGLFLDPDAPSLRANPCQQLWRETMLAQCLIDNGPYDEGCFVVIAPVANWHVQNAVVQFEEKLAPAADNKVRFLNLTLDDVVEAIRLTDEDHAKALHRRYLDFWLVDGEIELHDAQPAEALQSRKAAPSQADGPLLPKPAKRRERKVAGPESPIPQASNPASF